MKPHLKTLLALAKKNKFEVIAVVLLLSVAGIAHAWNMFHFPYYESDEGTYMAQAWSFLTQGHLSHYTYWYDHAPAGWLLIALWVKVTAGFFTFGFSVNSGRVLMLILHLFSCLFLYLIARKLTKTKIVGFLAVLFFSLSPLAIYFQRRVLLDNIMVFWVLLAIVLLIYNRNKLRYIILSAIVFGVAILSKENAIFFMPVFMYIIFADAHKRQRNHAMFLWVSITLSITSLYFIYASLKGELFPMGTLLGGSNEHVSLLGTLQYQGGRSAGSLFSADPGSLTANLKIWLKEDPLLIYAGIVSTIACLVIGIRNKTSRVIGAFSLVFWLFLARGGTVIEFYVIPLIPFISLSTAFVLFWLHRQILKIKILKIIRKPTSILPYAFGVVMLLIMATLYSSNSRGQYSIYKTDQTTSQIQAVNWMLEKKNANQFYAIDDYGYVDIHTKNNGNYKYADYYWKVDRDSDVRDKRLFGDWKNMDIIAATPQLRNDILSSGLKINLTAYQNAKPIKTFWQNGWGVTYYAVSAPHQILSSSWESYKDRFIKSGQVVDLGNKNTTTSEGQGYGMLRAAWSNDKQEFDAIYNWTKNNLQQGSGSLTWKWQPNVLQKDRDMGTAPDADEDAALALIFAYNQWHDDHYLQAAKKILGGLWTDNVVSINGAPYLTAGNWANQPDSVTVNPSYLSPAWYKIFAKVDHHQWQKLADTSYEVLAKCTSSPLDKTRGVLPPEWCSIDKTSGQASSTNKPQPIGTEYGFNAMRVPWRISLDYLWNKDTRAKNYLSSLSFLGTEWQANKKLVTAYQHDGNVWENYESVAPYSGSLGYFMIQDKSAAKQIYETKILSKFYQDSDKAYWEDPNNYYTQNLAWFGTALYTNGLPDLSDSTNSR